MAVLFTSSSFSCEYAWTRSYSLLEQQGLPAFRKGPTRTSSSSNTTFLVKGLELCRG